MVKYDIIIALITALGAVSSAIAAISAVIISKAQQKYANRPIVQVESIITVKSSNGSFTQPDNNKEHYRLISGEQRHDVGLSKRVPVEKLTPLETEFLLNHKNNVCLHLFRGKKSLIINLLNSDNSIVAELNTNTIKFINHGAPIQKAKFNYAEILALNGAKVHLDGSDYAMNFPIGSCQSFEIFIVEASNNFQNSICQMTDSVYNDLPHVFDLLCLDTSFHINYLKLEFSVTFYSASNDFPYTYIYTLDNITNEIFITTKEVRQSVFFN